MESNRKNLLMRSLPSVNEILSRSRIVQDRDESVPRFVMVKAAQEALDHFREQMISQSGNDLMVKDDLLEQLEKRILKTVRTFRQQRLQPVINATGVVLHTNLGRALLPESAVNAVTMAASAYTNLELDLASGKRGHRYRQVEELLCELTGAESAVVVNNNAAAVLLALSTLAQGREAIVSRGQLVEIGGSFRVPDVMAQSGVTLVEVGTTNKTSPSDYRNAINSQTGLLVRVHTSNYRIVGFTQEVSLKEMIRLGVEQSIPVMEDLGSGTMVDLTRWKLPAEPTVLDSIRAGVDVVTFSGDKLLGGPQAGIILGKRKHVDLMKKHPLLRALRMDKMTLAALEAVLYLYIESAEPEQVIPVLSMLTLPLEDLDQRASALAEAIQSEWKGKGKVTVIDTTSQAGGGSLPSAEIPTRAVALQYGGLTANELESYLRAADPPILTRILMDQVILDPRTIRVGEEEVIVRALAQLGRAGQAD